MPPQQLILVRAAALLASMLIASPGLTATVASALPDPRMLGEWVLDAERSDDVMKKLMQQRHDRIGAPPGGPGGGGPPPNGASPPAGGPPEAAPPGLGPDGHGPGALSGSPALDDELTNGQSISLQIEQGRVTLLYAGQRRRDTYDPNHSERVVSASGGNAVGEFGYSIAYRDADALVIETPRGNGDALFERYTLDTDGRTLQMTMTMAAASAQPGSAIRRVFVRRERRSAPPLPLPPGSQAAGNEEAR